MKKIIIFLMLVIVICFSFFAITNTLNNSIKEIPENAILL